METETIPKFERNKEYTIGEKFMYKGLVFVCKEKTFGHHCKACVFSSHDICNDMICMSKERVDESYVYFDFEEELYTAFRNAPVNTTINYHGRKFKIVKDVWCEQCFFKKFYCNSFPCIKEERLDRISVAFKLLGE